MSNFRPSSILRQKTDDRQVDDLQRALAGPIAQLQDLSPLNGVMVTDLTFPTISDVIVLHRMDRDYQGFIICRVRYIGGTLDAPLIFEQVQDSSLNSSQITLFNASNSSVLADVWVY